MAHGAHGILSPSAQGPLVHGILLSPTDDTDFFASLKILAMLCIRKINFTSALAYNKIRSLTTSKSLYG